MIKLIKYLLSVLGSPITLFIVWVYNFRPYNYLAELFNWSINSKNPETVEAAINVALSMTIYNVAGKLIGLLKRPIKFNLKIKDPTNKVGKNEIMYDANVGKLKKLVLEIEVDYKSDFWRVISSFFCSHNVELHWNNIFKVDCDDMDENCMELLSNKLVVNISSNTSSHQNKVGITQDLFFTVRNTSINRGAFVPKLSLKNNVFMNVLFLSLLKSLSRIEITTLDVHLEKEN